MDGSNGFKLNGESNSFSGYSVSGAGDVTGDGVDDFIIGAYSANSYKGVSYVVSGPMILTASPSPSASPTPSISVSPSPSASPSPHSGAANSLVPNSIISFSPNALIDTAVVTYMFGKSILEKILLLSYGYDLNVEEELSLYTVNAEQIADNYA
ncbi:FG-GAP repeat-containing protein [endosymbiont of Acanthamoeba sp. UWC8]|uniref:integrin alpha n=1 Tax=endosymbiont of Acanthamoeba sp. UWC8 TaxID=86106 RepID=UPI0004D0E1D3|nr:integrin alpha [endosymbiont of Acanthamoeba sp. UWC8]AIF80985.1 FG-GAP repeat-containing protein [endosymbiont of Acanthamoeba sp. UWC8]